MDLNHPWKIAQIPIQHVIGYKFFLNIKMIELVYKNDLTGA